MKHHITSIDDITIDIVRNAVLLYPTETVYGLGCSAHNLESIHKIGIIKNRSQEKQYIFLVDSFDRISTIVEKLSDAEMRLLNSNAVVTLLILPNNSCPPHYIHPINGLFAVRKTSHPICLKLISLLDSPIVSTSANPGGQPAAFHYSEIDTHIIEYSDIGIAIDNTEQSSPSTIVRYDKTSNSFEIIRQGSTTLADIERICFQ
jgi:L-threonylcarbamoyladenylate synthase